MAEFGSKLDNNWLSLVLTVGRVDEWQLSSLVLVQAAWACDKSQHMAVEVSSELGIRGRRHSFRWTDFVRILSDQRTVTRDE